MSISFRPGDVQEKIREETSFQRRSVEAVRGGRNGAGTKKATREVAGCTDGLAQQKNRYPCRERFADQDSGCIRARVSVI